MLDEWIFERRISEEDARQFSHIKELQSRRAKDSNVILYGPFIELIFPGWNPGQENVLFCAPHDDDNHLGQGLLTQAVSAFGGAAYYLVATDGRYGCPSLGILEIGKNAAKRKVENVAASSLLGVPEERIIRLDYVDGSLPHCKGIEVTTHGPDGLQIKLARELRRIRATRALMPTYSRYGPDHPDHRALNETMRIAVAHAAGEGMWEELGQPVQVKSLLESAVYSRFDIPADCALHAPQSAFERKLAAISKFESQKQIAGLVQKVVEGGPIEHFLTIDLSGYNPKQYHQNHFGCK